MRSAPAGARRLAQPPVSRSERVGGSVGEGLSLSRARLQVAERRGPPSDRRAVEWIRVLWPEGQEGSGSMTVDRMPPPSGEPEPQSSTMRCAIYVRKSTEEGLNQEFNTLEAQREAAEAYIRSQRHAGWTALGEGMTTEDTVERTWNGRRCENCWRTSKAVKSMRCWSTRSIGSAAHCWILPAAPRPGRDSCLAVTGPMVCWETRPAAILPAEQIAASIHHRRFCTRAVCRRTLESGRPAAGQIQ